MAKIKPSLPRGTRDFSPQTMGKRNIIFNTIRKTFELFGFQPLETPALENLSVLTGKYGDEGDKLLFRILNSGDFLSKVPEISEVLPDSTSLSERICEKGLRYDLTVPFARHVVMNRNEITLPFKRYQIQPVWRADRPQKGRYREFYQCDADVIGTDSLLCEAEICLMVQRVFRELGLKKYMLKINSRKILEGMAETAGAPEKSAQFFVILDKLDKIGLENMQEELSSSGFDNDFIQKVSEAVSFHGTNREKIDFLQSFLSGSNIGLQGLSEINRTLEFVEMLGVEFDELDFDLTLARGLSYYTGVIFEAKAIDVQIGSIGGGGRYDNLTGVFGIPEMSGVGFSFGIDRIFDVMEELRLFDENKVNSTKVLIAHLEENAAGIALNTLTDLRAKGINAEYYPDPAKLKKQLNYANKKGIPYVILFGADELARGTCSLKNMDTGDQVELAVNELIAHLS